MALTNIGEKLLQSKISKWSQKLQKMINFLVPDSAINEAEKVEIRRNFLQSFGHEPLYQIALQAAVSMGKIARYDVPREWPELLPALVQAVQSNESILQHRALLVLHHVIKALASKRYV